jgi:outer membrane receptor for ferrienterochelin and colicins
MRRRALYILAGQAALFLPPTIAQAQEQQAAERPKVEASSSEQEQDTIEVESDLSEGLDDLSLIDLLQLDLRVATTKTDTTVQASPAAVTVISREEIERYGYRSVADALRDVVGTYFVDDHITPNLGVRGIPGAAYEGSGAVKVMIDNVPVSFRTTGENWLGPALVPMSNVERIEIVKGPTSSLYGADAFLGVVNVITRDASDKSWGEASGTGMVTYGGGPGVHAEAGAGINKRPFRLTLGAQFDQEDRSGLRMPASSPAPTLADEAGEQSRNQILRSGVAIFDASYVPTRRTTLSLSGRYAQQRSNAEFAPWMQFTAPADGGAGTRLALQQGSVTFKSKSRITHKFSLDTTTTGFFGGTLQGDEIVTGDTLAVAHRDLSYFGGEGTIEGTWQPVTSLRLVLGAEGSLDREHLGAADYRSREDGSELPSPGAADDMDTTLLNVAGRAQATWTIVEDYLVPTGGIRFDHNSVYGNRVSGRIAVVSRVMPDLYLKLAYGSAFKAATPLLLYGRPLTIGDVIGSPSLAPQEFRSLEFIADYRIKSVVDIEATVSRWDLIDRAVFQSEQINLVAKNAADAKGWTVEASVKTQFSRVIGGSLGFEWAKAERESGESGYLNELFGTSQAIYPSYITRARVWTQPKGLHFEAWAAGNVVGPRKASDPNTLEAGERYTLPAYGFLDLGVRTVDLHFWGPRLTEFSVRGQNVLNSAGDGPGFFGIDYPAAPPKIMVEARQEF